MMFYQPRRLPCRLFICVCSCSHVLYQQGRLRIGGAANMAEMDGRIRPHAERCLCMTPLPGGSPVPSLPGAKPRHVIAINGKTAIKRPKPRKWRVRRLRNTFGRCLCGSAVQ